MGRGWAGKGRLRHVVEFWSFFNNSLESCLMTSCWGFHTSSVEDSTLEASLLEFPLSNGGTHIPLKAEILYRWVRAFDVRLCESMIL